MPSVFTPPTVDDVPRVLPDTRGPALLLMRHYSELPRGRSVVKVGATYTTMDIPTTDQMTAAGVEGTDWFLGGHTYVVTDAVAAALFAAGYTVSDLVLGSEGGATLVTEGGDILVPEGV